MAATPEAVHNLAIRHRIGLTRYSNAVVRKTIALLNRIETQVVERLARTSNETFAGRRLEELLAEIRSIQRTGWAVISERVNADLNQLAANETAFASKLASLSPASQVATVDAVFSGAPALTQVIAAVNARPFQGRLLREWLADTEEAVAKRVRDTIRQGFIEGRTTDQIVRSLRGTKAAQYKDGALEISRRGAEAIVRTAITHTANVAHEEVWKANSDVVKGVRWTSTLDARTTLICASRDGNVYPIGQGPRPPAHINCRSVTTPILDQIEGVTPFTPPTYAEWLKKQPVEVQDDVLGPTRAKLFRFGGLTLDRFVDRAGHTITLDQLRARDVAAFRQAGV